MRKTKFNAPKLPYKRYHKQRLVRIIKSDIASKVYFGVIGLRVLNYGFLNPKQLELSRRFLIKTIGKRRK